MVYSNYINAACSNAAYYINTYNNGGPYGYQNYNNTTLAAPTAYTINSSTTTFAPGAIAYAASINTLANDISALSVNKVASNGTPISTTPSMTSATTGAAISYGVINNLIANIAALWTTIRGGSITTSGFPTTKTTGDKIQSADMIAIVNATQTVASTDQPRGIGYLNCQNWINSGTYSNWNGVNH